MSEELTKGRSAVALARVQSVVDELQSIALDSWSDDETLALWRGLEVARNRLACVDHALVRQAATRGLAERFGASGMPALLRDVLRVGVREAKARILAADAAGPRVGLTGEPLGPIFQRVAAAQADGSISPAQARTVVHTVDGLPDEVAAEVGETVESLLVKKATEIDADQFERHAHDLGSALDQDGALQRLADRERRRDLRLSVRADGSSHFAGDLTAELTEHLRTVLDPLAKPASGDGTPDPRSAGQRRHDALLEVCKLAERSGQLPNTGGVTCSVVLTIPAESDGVATTGHGVRIPASEALNWLDGESRVITVAMSGMKCVDAYGSTHRIFTENQRLAIIARDKCCVFPGCDAPPAHCETHHVIEYQDGGPTCVSNGVLLCAYHHRHFTQLGWIPVDIDGQIWWQPPGWIDPERRPRRNQRCESGVRPPG